ncbi:MAG: flagellar basal body rod protein FlgC [Planctomycetaceae bacterium]|nr:flagellar basal body rod protein FlgC [Planctomycetaceae bacterium]
MVDLMNSMYIASSGIQAQGERMKVIAQNIANVDSVAQSPGGKPYQRKVISFQNVLNKELEADTVQVKKVDTDESPYEKKYEPHHPAADQNGYVLYPNVNVMVEMTDMKEAQRSYEANIKVVDMSKQMMLKTLDILR